MKTSAEYAFLRDRGRSVDLARKLAAKKWDDDRYPGEASDDEHVLLHGADAPLDVLTEQVPYDGESYDDERDRFGVLARRLWQPLLDHEASVVV